MAKKTEPDVAQEIRKMVEEAVEKARHAESADSHGHLSKADELNYEVDNLISMIFDRLRGEGL